VSAGRWLVLALATAGCAREPKDPHTDHDSATSGAVHDSGASSQEAGEAADSGTLPDDGDDGDAPDGEDVYYTICGGCHGVDAEGGAGPSLQGTALSVSEVTTIAMEGTGSMPAMLRDQPAEASAVAEWLVTRFGS
jgi:mono/diheme cytochrome c family protein